MLGDCFFFYYIFCIENTRFSFSFRNISKLSKYFDSYIQNIDRSGNYSIALDSKDDKNKRKKFVINNKKYIITPLYDGKEFFIKNSDDKYVLYLNNNHVNQIKDVNSKQQEDIKLDEINSSSKLNNDNDFFYLLLAISIGIFILFGIFKG